MPFEGIGPAVLAEQAREERLALGEVAVLVLELADDGSSCVGSSCSGGRPPGHSATS
ncbi:MULTISPECIES: hypothetical protein [unclassified Streptosporangium]|uniref:hypothetical protein n=1 Tax=unclassified Streptosporangium TaxID=2632669 RepID=UPI002E284F2D|nr:MULTISPECIES: hypothetical protein [unclassified Streptosporangium]